MHGTLKVNSCRLILYKFRLQCTTCFLQCSFFFTQHVDLVASSLRVGFTVYPCLMLCACGPRTHNTICWGVGIFFLGFLFLLVWLLCLVVLIDVAGILQKVGDADSRAYTRSQV